MTIWYRGASYQLGRGQHCYALWALGAPPSRPLEWWPETPDGWQAAWSRFTAVEVPATITHLRQPAGPVAGTITAAALLVIGVGCGIGGLFPGYLAGASLAQQPDQLLPHAVYLAAWAASALLILTGGRRRRAGALLGAATSVVTFGFFFADLGTVIAGGARLMGGGLALSLGGWLACAAGSALACQFPAGDVARLPRGRAARPIATLVAAVTAAVGAAITFAPSWDSYTLSTPAGTSQSLTAGNIFASPGPVIAGNIAVMVAVVAVAAIAAVWLPLRLGAALLAGAVIPLAAEAISALVQVGERVSPGQFGLSAGQAARIGLHISTGLTPVFWVYVACVVALAATGAWMLVPAGPRRQVAAARPAPAGSAAGGTQP
jgi:hypothetical protein